MIELETPLSEKDVRSLSCGDTVELSGIIYTARDMAHKWFFEEKPGEFREKLRGSAIYHCGPIVSKKENSYEFVSAGPTTSIREEPYMADVIKEYDVRAVIGKGGMGEKTLEAMKESGCVYLSAVGGAAAVLAESVKEVLNVYKLEEFGVPEAVWEIRVENFPAIVSMDAKGESLHERIYSSSEIKLENFR